MSNTVNTKSTTSDQQNQGTCQDTEPSQNLTIDCLPDEVLLDIFNFYRQSIYPYTYFWKKRYVWFNLAHVCGRWHAVMFASSSRLDLSIMVRPQKPGFIETIRSSPLPIFIDVESIRGDITNNAIQRMHTALGHRDRVREISFGSQGYDRVIFGTDRMGVFFEKFITATSYHFPALETLVLYFLHRHEPDIPATFLRGPDLSDLRLRHLELYNAPLSSVSGLLWSAAALTDLTLRIAHPRNGVFDPSQGSYLLTCLQGMRCLRSLDLEVPYNIQDESQHSTPKDTVPLSKLTRFHYHGPTIFLNNLVTVLSAPSLQDADFVASTTSPVLYLPRVIDDVSEEFRSISVNFNFRKFHLVSSTYSGKIDHLKPYFSFKVESHYDSIQSINSTPSTKFTMAEELTLCLPSLNITEWERRLSLREFLRQFLNVRVLRMDPFVPEIGLYLQQDNEEGIFPVLEEIELSIKRGESHEEYQRRGAEALAAFELFVSARERVGRLVKVYHCESE